MADPRLGASVPLVPPLYTSAVYRIPDLDALDRISNGEEPGYIYARDGHPNAHRLAEMLGEREGAKWTVIAGSGMSAISAACLALVRAGDRIIASNRLYGRTNQLLKVELAHFGVKTEFVDVNDLDRVRHALKIPAKLLIVETLSNPLLRIADVPALANVAHQQNCKLLVDNTFASPVLFRPLEHGADLVMESLTKMIGGHSDVTLGLLAGNDPELLPLVNQAVSVWGLASSPHECWLTERSLPTLDLRMKAATANAATLARELVSNPALNRVIYPGLPDHPDRELAKKLLPDGCGNMMCIELKAPGREPVNRFMKIIPFCPSLGDVATTCSHPATTSHRYEPAEEKTRQGITDGLLRLSVGIEGIDVIRRRIAAACGLAK